MGKFDFPVLSISSRVWFSNHLYISVVSGNIVLVFSREFEKSLAVAVPLELKSRMLILPSCLTGAKKGANEMRKQWSGGRT